MNERLRSLRRELSLSQDAFGRRLGVTGAGISKIESGDRNLTEQMILSIAREFSVNEEWLRTGNGEMFANLSADEELAYIVGSAIPNASDTLKNTFIALGKLSKEFSDRDWEVVKKFVDALAGK